MIRTIKLYGHLGKKFGKIHKFDIRTPAEAVRALSANYPEFHKYIIEHNMPGYKIIVGDENRSDKELLQYPADGDIKIIPVIQGSGGSWGTVILGVALIAASVAMPYAAGAFAESAVAAGMAGGAEGLAAGLSTANTIMTVAGAASSAMFAVGASLTLSGVSSLLFTPSRPSTAGGTGNQDQISSTHFNGPINLAQQGNPVPIAYGKVRVGSQVVSAGIITSKVV